MTTPSSKPTPRRGIADTLAQVAGGAVEQRLLKEIRAGPVPRHLAIIMDGNRRYAESHGLEREQGHLRGKDKLEELLDWCLEVGLRTLTVYALSTENFHRERAEVEELMRLFEENFRRIGDDPRVHQHQIRVRALGNRALLPPPVVRAIEYAEMRTQGYDQYRYNIALAYGGREDILQAIRTIATEVKEGKLKPEEIDDRVVSSRLYTQDLPDPDLIFRTSGEERISNFLLWQSAYAELYFCDVLWPGLRKLDFLRAIHAYQLRRRRYGT
jgi:tritrans,polycis-undecaprenyl-diphosphate synthase [geranylgeranyl-diphosphate specific]